MLLFEFVGVTSGSLTKNGYHFLLKVFFMNVNYPIPWRLNIALSVLLIILYLACLKLAGEASSFFQLCGIAFVFAFLMIPVYSLFHEATHRIFHPNPTVNYCCGVILGTLFMVSFTFLRRAHIGHHRRNRTDLERFELYYSHEIRWKKALFLYANMIGFYWCSLPLSVLIFALYPPLMNKMLWVKQITVEAILRGVEPRLIPKIRWESIFILSVHGLIFYLFGYPWKAYLLLFGAHAFTWSSQNYVNHAFSPRDILNGAHNHKMNWFCQHLYLNFNHHLVHHRHPTLAWIHLPKFVNEVERERISYGKAWLRLWKGPVLTTEGPPKLIEDYFQDIEELH